MSATMAPEIEAQAISMIRGFAMDAPLHAKSGHQGTAMALAPLAASGIWPASDRSGRRELGWCRRRREAGRRASAQSILDPQERPLDCEVEQQGSAEADTQVA